MAQLCHLRANLGITMKLLEANHITIIASLFLCCALMSSRFNKEKLRYSQPHTIGYDYDQEQTLLTLYRDTMGNDSLFWIKSNENIPIHYFKYVATEVCFDSECRLLNITVFWNITGRYLGFELPKGEFLSKHDHEPFSNDEYERLNDLLADPNLSLGGISFEKLIEIPETESDSIDGISGATTKEVSEMVVKGAAYTTYTLWNIVHGPTKDSVANLTETQLSPDLIDLILKKPGYK